MKRALPRTIKPMLAKSSPPFDSSKYLFELKWDGTRCLTFAVGKGIRLQNRRLADITHRYPEFQVLERALDTGTVLDGEIVVLEGGRPSFRRLQERDHVVAPDRIEILSGVLPATYVVFDLLYLKGRPLLNKPLSERRKLLEGLFPLAENVILSEAYEHGKKLFPKAVEKGFEGIMAKDRGSPYLPGVRSPHWLKIKRAADLDAVVCGYTEGSGKRSATLGALVLGVFSDSKLRYIGRVGTGLDEDTLKRLAGTLKHLKTSRRTLESEVKTDRKIHWTKPELVVKVGYQEKTREGKLRAPVFKGIREDKPPEECTS